MQHLYTGAEWRYGMIMTMTRIGIGTDVHRLVAGRELWLAGLRWDSSDGLAGHSDGDCAAHAIVDAILSAAGLGDIGTLVGVDDPKHAGSASISFIQQAVTRVADEGLRIGNVSVQIIGNQPRIGARRAEAERVLGDAVGAPVSVSGTSTDGLGLTGRGEGIAAIATALLITGA